MTPSVPDSRPVYIYALLDPDGTPRYVGKADDPARRFAQHLWASHLKPVTHKNCWLKGLLAQGKRPSMVILREVTQETWPQEETAAIAAYREAGYRLTNLTDGGEGASGHQCSEQTRARLSASHMGKRLSSERRAKMSAAHKGKVRTPEHNEKLAAGKRGKVPHVAVEASRRARTGKPLPPEQRAKIAASMKGKARSPETQAKLSAVLSKSPAVLATLAANRLKWTGKPRSPEQRAKISAGVRAANERARLATKPMP